jgi:hypothetical protein
LRPRRGSGFFRHGGNKAVTGGGYSFDKAGGSRVIAELPAKLRHDAAESIVGDGRAIPDRGKQLVFVDHPITVLDEVRENLESLRFQVDPLPVVSQLQTTQIYNEAFKEEDSYPLGRHHKNLITLMKNIMPAS